MKGQKWVALTALIFNPSAWNFIGKPPRNWCKKERPIIVLVNPKDLRAEEKSKKKEAKFPVTIATVFLCQKKKLREKNAPVAM